MLAAAKAAAPAATRVVAVTVLTSLDSADLAEVGINASPFDHVGGSRRSRARAASMASSARAPKSPRRGRHGPAAFSWFPESGPPGPSAGDQKRIVTPAQAIEDGASVLVIGRPVTGAGDPARALMDIAATLSHMPAEARI